MATFISPLAEDDLDSIWNYLAEYDAENAARFSLELLQSFWMLAQNPMAGTNRSNIRNNLRMFPKNDYCIFYYPDPNGVQIMRILHSARDIETIFDEDTSN